MRWRGSRIATEKLSSVMSWPAPARPLRTTLQAPPCATPKPTQPATGRPTPS